MMWIYYVTDKDCQQQAREWCERHGTFGTVDASGRRVVCLSPEWVHAHPGKVRAQVGEKEWQRAICPDIVLANVKPGPAIGSMEWIKHAAIYAVKAAFRIDRRPDELIAALKAVCDPCDHKIAGVCTGCLCPVVQKRKVIGEHCPEGYWKDALAEHGEIEVGSVQ